MKKENKLLDIKKLEIYFGKNRVVSDVNLNINKGEIVSIVGESGSGKSVSARSILRLDEGAKVKGKILFKNKDILDLSEKELLEIRGRKIAMIFQEPMTSLNPLHRVGKQIGEVLKIHFDLSEKEIEKRVFDLLKKVGISKVKSSSYPHELSGGQRQRVMIAMALAGEPELLIADEPTTALDVSIQEEILQLIKKLSKEMGVSVLFISHDLSVVKKISSSVYVMKEGQVVESGDVKKIMKSPKHKYTKMLIDASVGKVLNNVKRKVLKNILEVKNLAVEFKNKDGILKAVDNVSFNLAKGKILGVVGESGSGKTTMAQAVLRLVENQNGSIKFDGQDIAGYSRKQMRKLRLDMQVVFQDPFSSLSPRMKVGEVLKEGLEIHFGNSKKAGFSFDKKVLDILSDVGLKKSDLEKYPHEFSGGQRQRIAIARALILNPKLLVLDEPTSALDVSIQADIIKLLKELAVKYSLTYVFITHDLKLIRSFADEVLVMKKGKIVENGNVKDIFNKPKNKYTKELISFI